MAYYIVLYNTLYKTNSFAIAKAKAILLLVELISKKKSPYTNTLNRRDPVFNKKDPTGIDKTKKISSKSENTKVSDIRHLRPESKHTTFGRSRSGINPSKVNLN